MIYTQRKGGAIEIKGKYVTSKGSGQITAEAPKNMVLNGKKILQN